MITYTISDYYLSITKVLFCTTIELLLYYYNTTLNNSTLTAYS